MLSIVRFTADKHARSRKSDPSSVGRSEERGDLRKIDFFFFFFFSFFLSAIRLLSREYSRGSRLARKSDREISSSDKRSSPRAGNMMIAGKRPPERCMSMMGSVMARNVNAEAVSGVTVERPIFRHAS